MALPFFFYRPEMLQYDFGRFHPLRPERLEKTIRLLKAEGVLEVIEPEPATEDDLLRVHTEEYIEAVKRAGKGECEWKYGLGIGDNPPFEGMHHKALWYVGGTVCAARAVVSGASLAFNMSGGLHHALSDRASGFCIYNDPAIAISILREKFSRVAYVDIDAHHGDGVQWIFYTDPSVLTISIHESGETLFPGTGYPSETGEPPHCLNIPLKARTTGDVWMWAFLTLVPPAIRAFNPEVIVLQMGADSHFEDPLAHLLVAVQEWLEAVKLVRSFGLPIVALGGGGYNLRTVPRMWAAGCMTLAGCEYNDVLPSPFAEEFGVMSYSDPFLPTPRGQGLMYAQSVVSEIERRFDLVVER